MSEGSTSVFVIPLAKAWKASRLRRADAAIRLVREFARRHTKAANVKISPKVSEKIWEKGRQNPPRRIRVVFEKEDENTVVVMLEGEKREEKEE
ncbi:MAG: 50S ribosomal protein L31e [Candidatus Caldarchaeum sp.]